MLLLVTLFQSRGQADGQNSYSDARVQGNPQIREWPQLQPHGCDQGEHAGEADKQRVNTTRPPTTQRHDSLSIAGEEGCRISDVGCRHWWRCGSCSVFNRNPTSEIRNPSSPQLPDPVQLHQVRGARPPDGLARHEYQAVAILERSAIA